MCVTSCIVSLSLTAPLPQATTGEATVCCVLCTHPLSHLCTGARRTPPLVHPAPSFLSARLPRNRCGRISMRRSTAIYIFATHVSVAELNARTGTGRCMKTKQMKDKGTWGAQMVYAEDTPHRVSRLRAWSASGTRAALEPAEPGFRGQHRADARKKRVCCPNSYSGLTRRSPHLSTLQSTASRSHPSLMHILRAVCLSSS